MGEELPMAGLVTCIPGGYLKIISLKRRASTSLLRRHSIGGSGLSPSCRCFEALSSYCSFGNRGPLGSDEICILDDNGDQHIFYFETFSNSYEVLTLTYHVRQHRLVVGFP